MKSNIEYQYKYNNKYNKYNKYNNCCICYNNGDGNDYVTSNNIIID